MSSSAPSAPPPPRRPLARRLQGERHAARARIAARMLRPPSAEQHAFDPMARGRLGLGAKLLVAGAAVVLSSMVHASVYGVGSWFGDAEQARRKREVVTIEVREREREPEKKPPPPPEPEAKVVKPPPPERRKVETPPPPEPPQQRGKSPPRVVGLSLDSTGQGGSGPAFGVGNTRQGKAETRAADPKKVGRQPPPSSPNQTATRIPTAGAKYVLPKRKRPSKPPYPAQLQSQGIEASVTVMVSLDKTGKVTSVKIIKGSGFPEFDESARVTALAESFEPATRDGTPIPYTLSYTYRFTLEDK